MLAALRRSLERHLLQLWVHSVRRDCHQDEKVVNIAVGKKRRKAEDGIRGRRAPNKALIARMTAKEKVEVSDRVLHQLTRVLIRYLIRSRSLNLKYQDLQKLAKVAESRVTALGIVAADPDRRSIEDSAHRGRASSGQEPGPLVFAPLSQNFTHSGRREAVNFCASLNVLESLELLPQGYSASREDAGRMVEIVRFVVKNLKHHEAMLMCLANSALWRYGSGLLNADSAPNCMSDYLYRFPNLYGERGKTGCWTSGCHRRDLA